MNRRQWLISYVDITNMMQLHTPPPTKKKLQECGNSTVGSSAYDEHNVENIKNKTGLPYRLFLFIK
jgi:hypothetical protein